MSLLILVMLVILVILKFVFFEKIERSDSQRANADVVPGKTAYPVVVNVKSCLQLPIQLGEGDFSPVENTLTCVLNEYTNAAIRKDQRKILALDYELKELVYAIQVIKNHDVWKAFWQSKDRLKYQYHSIIGVYVHDTGFSYDWGLSNDRVMQSRVEALAEYDQLKPRFDRIRVAFLANPKNSVLAHIESLYELDEQLEKLIKETDGKFDGTIPLPNYPEIGVYMGRSIHYYGTIRQVADKLLPPEGFIDPKTGTKIKVKGDRYSKLKWALEESYLSYKSLKLIPEDAEKLYELSDELSKLVKSINKEYPWERSKIFWEDKYGALGLYIGHYSDQLDFSQKLMVDSYKLNPDSRYREEALVATISGDDSMSSFSGVPNIVLAKTYLSKYPDGKYLSDVYGILATFYQNLYEELMEDEKSSSDFGCYSEYLAAYPADKNSEVARNKAILYYKKLLVLKQPGKEGYKKALSNLENRKDGHRRYWCTD